MTTFTSKIAEIEKGCGKTYKGVTNKDKCYSIPRFNNLCPTCQAKLQTLLEAQEMIKRAVDEYVIDIDIDKISSKEYPMVFKLSEDINKRNKQLKEKLGI